MDDISRGFKQVSLPDDFASLNVSCLNLGLNQILLNLRNIMVNGAES
jgi:hypothetical protein